LQFFNDITPNAWNSAGYNLSVGATSAFGGGSIFQADTSGNIYLYNVYMGEVGLQFTGSFNGCPTAGNPCPPSGVTHNYTMTVELPGGIGPSRNISGGVAPTQDVTNYANAYDYTPLCSWTFSSPTDSNCKPTTSTGKIVCGLTGATLITVSAPTDTGGRSYDARIWDGNYQSFGYTSVPGFSSLKANCGIDKALGANACASGTTPTCPVTLTQKLVRDSCVGDVTTKCSEPVLDAALKASCGLFKPGGLAWAEQKAYANFNDGTRHYVSCSGAVHFFIRKYPVHCQ
jgi:hypothetical protein